TQDALHRSRHLSQGRAARSVSISMLPRGWTSHACESLRRPASGPPLVIPEPRITSPSSSSHFAYSPCLNLPYSTERAISKTLRPRGVVGSQLVLRNFFNRYDSKSGLLIEAGQGRSDVRFVKTGSAEGSSRPSIALPVIGEDDFEGCVRQAETGDM